MYESSVFIDLPNLYSNLLRSGIDEPRTLRDYFLYWLDFDLLTHFLTSEYSNTWIFYSGNRIGPSDNRIKDEYLSEFITRVNSLTGVTARDVNIPGEQREPASYTCSECGHEGTAQWESEKGIDSSLTVHLFDTMDSWGKAYLLSGDADFVPAVQSLRRRGKIVIGAGFSNAAPDLKRECYDYIDLRDTFFIYDIAAFELFGESGIIKQWLTAPLSPLPDFSGSVRLGCIFEKYSITLSVIRGRINIKQRQAMLQQFHNRFPDYRLKQIDSPTELTWEIHFPLDHNFEGINRRISTLKNSIKGLLPPDRGGPIPLRNFYVLKHALNKATGEYSPVT